MKFALEGKFDHVKVGPISTTYFSESGERCAEVPAPYKVVRSGADTAGRYLPMLLAETTAAGEGVVGTLACYYTNWATLLLSIAGIAKSPVRIRAQVI